MLLPPFHLLVLKIGLDLGGVPRNAIENVCSYPLPAILQTPQWHLRKSHRTVAPAKGSLDAASSIPFAPSPA